MAILNGSSFFLSGLKKRFELLLIQVQSCMRAILYTGSHIFVYADTFSGIYTTTT